MIDRSLSRTLSPTLRPLSRRTRGGASALVGLTALAGLLGAVAPAAARGPRPPVDGPRIQVAILLDTSGSMSGLIDQARTELWNMVNELATARRDGQAPTLEVALYEYGKSSIPASEGYIRMITPLTTDLDRVSDELFALTTNGGDEYCGQVIQSAVRGLAWSPDSRDLKMIFIAGNEPFTQGPVDYRRAAREAIGRGITVSTIHCGDYETGVRTGWKDGAMLADGAYMHIDHNRKVAHIRAPQDEELARLGRELNATYVGYGKAGRGAKMRQALQDRNAMGSGGVSAAAARAVTKSSHFYKNAGWDLVDAVKEGKVDLEEAPAEELPAAMRGMTPAQRQAYVAKLAAKRAALQAKIRKLSAARRKFLAKARKKARPRSGPATLDEVMVKEMKRQARKKSFSVK